MTEGKIYSKISLFALPIFIGQLFQQFYNVADSLVVGRYLGKQALAARQLVRQFDFSSCRIH